MAASSVAERNPPSLATHPVGDADFTGYSFDPIRTQFQTYLAALQQQGLAFRGDPPVSSVRVKSLDLTAQPYPSVQLIDCLAVSNSWRAYKIKTGSAAPLGTSSAHGPTASIVDVILYQGHWGVRQITSDPAIPCPG